MPFYTDYFRISYPLPKLDLIAIADFAAGKDRLKIEILKNNPKKKIKRNYELKILF